MKNKFSAAVWSSNCPNTALGSVTALELHVAVAWLELLPLH